MAYISANSGSRSAYGIKRLFFDTIDDLFALSTKNLYPGSTAFIIDVSETYMLNNKYEWKKVNVGGGGGGSDPSPDDNIIYEGGVET